MSVAIVHRPRVQVPRLSIIVVLAITVAAALVIVLSIQASARIPAPTSAASLSTVGASVWTAAEARERPPVVRALVSGEMLATAPAEAPAPLRRSNHTLRLAGEGAASSRLAGIGRLEEPYG